MPTCRAWGRVPVPLCCAVAEWCTRTPRLIQGLRTVSVVAGMVQIGPHVFVGLEHVGINVHDEDGRHLASWRPPNHAPEYVDPTDLAATPTGEVAVLHAGYCIKVLRTDGTLVRAFGAVDISQRAGHGPPHAIAVTPTGQVVVTSDRTMVVFELSTGQCVHEWRRCGPVYRCSSLCAAPGGECVLAVNWDNDCINVFRVSDGQLVQRWSNYGWHARRPFEMPSSVAMWCNRVFVTNFAWVGVFRWSDRQPLRFMDAQSLEVSYPRRVLVTRQHRLWVAGASWELSLFDLRLAH